MAYQIGTSIILDDNNNIVNVANINSSGITTAATGCITGTFTGSTICATTGFSGPGANLTNIPSNAITGDLGGNVSISTFTSSGTWTKPGTAKMVYVELISGGQGGYNGVSITNQPSLVDYSTPGYPDVPAAYQMCCRGGCGGSGGCFNLHLYAASDLPPSVPVTVGSGGASNGGSGGQSCFNTLGSSSGPAARYIGNSGGNGAGLGGYCLGGYVVPGRGVPPTQYTCVACLDCTGCGAASASAPSTPGMPFSWSPAAAPDLSSVNGVNGTGYAGGSGGSLNAPFTVSPTGGIVYPGGPRSVTFNSITSGTGGAAGCSAGGGGGAAGSSGGTGGNGKVIVYTWE